MYVCVCLEAVQIFDTVELYFLPGKRWLSLKFLAREVLGMAVQTENHDAIEDARTALSLYMRYQEMQIDGTFPQVCKTLTHARTLVLLQSAFSSSLSCLGCA